MTSSASLPDTVVVLFDGFDDLDAVGPLEVLHGAGFPIRQLAIPAGTTHVASAHGLRLNVSEATHGTPGLVIVPGGGWRDRAATGVRAQCAGQLPAQLAAWHADGAVIASVCTGAMLLAEAGLLTGRPAVTNRIALDDLAQVGAEVHPEARVVDDGSVVTCGGPAAGLDLAVHLVGRFRGERSGAMAAEALEHTPVGRVLFGEGAQGPALAPRAQTRPAPRDR